MATVREATADDLAGVRRVALRACPDAYRDALSAETVQQVLSDWYGRDALAELVEDDGTVLLVADDGSGIIGFCAVSWDGDEGEIEDVHVDPDHRDGDVAATLIDAAIGTLPDRVARVGVGLVDGHDTPRIYQNHGFEKQRTVEDEFFGESVECDIYVRDL